MEELKRQLEAARAEVARLEQAISGEQARDPVAAYVERRNEQNAGALKKKASDALDKIYGRTKA